MPFAPELVSHSQKVCSLYKQALRLIDAHYVARFIVRYHQVILRAEFEKNRCITDPKEQRRLYYNGVNEVFNKMHPLPAILKFSKSVGCVAHERVVEPPDWVLDYWHPLEKAQYPSYFKKREQRKAQYVEKWKSGEIR